MMDNTLMKIESPQIQTSLMQSGWNLPSSITEDDWKVAGSFLVKVNQARQWWLGDWWNACKWGEGKAACDEIGVDYQTAADCGMVAKKFQISSRNEKLTFSHHKAVCSIEDKDIQDELLDWAEKNGVSVRVLRSEVKTYLETKAWDDAQDFETKRELADAHKRIAELESGRSANLDNLIPELMKKYKGASITIGMANRLSVLDEDQQQVYLEMLESKQWEENQSRKLADEKLRALEDLARATRERDELKEQLEQISETDTASVLLEKERALKQARAEYERKLFEQREQAEKTASEIHEKRFRDQLAAAEEAVKKAQKEKQAAVEGRGAANKQVEDLEREIEKLNAQLEVDNPVNVDNSRVKHIEDAGRGFLISLNELRKDMARLGGGMEYSIEAAEEVIKKASLELSKLQGMQDQIINI
jgi:hypothetical protein